MGTAQGLELSLGSASGLGGLAGATSRLRGLQREALEVSLTQVFCALRVSPSLLKELGLEGSTGGRSAGGSVLSVGPRDVGSDPTGNGTV